jgi:ATP-binding cassette subfamily B protein
MVKTDASMTLWTLLPLPILSLAIYKVSSIINQKVEDHAEKPVCYFYFCAGQFFRNPCGEIFCKEKYIKKTTESK